MGFRRLVVVFGVFREDVTGISGLENIATHDLRAGQDAGLYNDALVRITI